MGSSHIAHSYDEWWPSISRVAYRERLFEDTSKNLSGSFLWVFFYQMAVFGFSLFWFINFNDGTPAMAAQAVMNFIGMLMLFPETFIYNACSGRLEKLSPEAIEIRAKAKALKNWLSQVPTTIEDARKWDGMFPWVVALGVPAKDCLRVRGTWPNVYSRDDEFSIAMDIEDVVEKAMRAKDKATGRREVAGTEFYERGI